MTAPQVITFSGHIDPDAFVEFAQHRARWLSVDIDVLHLDTHAARVAVRGADDLVDAFEMAVSLGPESCLMRDTWRGDDTPASTNISEG